MVNAIKRFSSCTNDGARIFVYNERGLHAYGTGFGGTVAGACVSKSQDDWQKRRGWLAYASGFLYLLLIDPHCQEGAHETEKKMDEGPDAEHRSSSWVELIKLNPLTLSVISRTMIGDGVKARKFDDSERSCQQLLPLQTPPHSLHLQIQMSFQNLGKVRVLHLLHLPRHLFEQT